MEDDWEAKWLNKTTEPYTIVHLHSALPAGPSATVCYWRVYYRSYKQRQWNVVPQILATEDELDVYRNALKLLQKLKQQSDNHYKRTNQEV